jgi:hypothetical protein
MNDVVVQSVQRYDLALRREVDPRNGYGIEVPKA